jgi:hypothetical protein
LALQVDITEPALVDAEDYVRFIREVKKEPEAGDRRFRGLVHATYSLEELPERCPVIPEHEQFSIEIRHLIYFFTPNHFWHRPWEGARRHLPGVSRLQTAGRG